MVLLASKFNWWMDPGMVIERALMWGWFWLPLVFAAYWFGKRKISFRAMVVLVALEAVAITLFATSTNPRSW